MLNNSFSLITKYLRYSHLHIPTLVQVRYSRRRTQSCCLQAQTCSGCSKSHLQQRPKAIHIRLTSDGRKVDLDTSDIIKTLKRIRAGQ